MMKKKIKFSFVFVVLVFIFLLTSCWEWNKNCQHSWILDESNSMPATCIEDGYNQYFCSLCSIEKEEPVISKGTEHKAIEDSSLDEVNAEEKNKAKCGAKYNVYGQCEYCHTSLVLTENYKADHKFNTYKIRYELLYNKAGEINTQNHTKIEGHVCDVCGEWNSSVANVTEEHNSNLKNENCITTSYKAQELGLCKLFENKCSCGYEYSIKIEHSWDEGHVAKEPTCTEKGIFEYTCTNADCLVKTKKEDINPLEHSWDEGHVVKEPSCTEKGIFEYTCLNADCLVKTKREDMNPLGHEFDESVKTKDCITRHCNRCELDIAPTAKHIYKDDYDCCDRVCTKCSYTIFATDSHSYADKYACHVRYCTACNKPDPVEYLNDSHNVSYRASTKTLAFDFSKYQKSENMSNVFKYERFNNSILIINPVEHGKQIDKIVFYGSYKTRSIEDNHLIESIVNGMAIKFSENWTSGVEIIFKNFALETNFNENVLNISNILANKFVKITFIGNNYLSNSSSNNTYGVLCKAPLSIIGEGDIETYIKGSIHSDSNCDINLHGLLTVYGCNGIAGKTTQNEVDGKAAISSNLKVSIKAGENSHLYGGNGAKPGAPGQASGRNVTGATGFHGGDGGTGISATNIELLSNGLHLHGGNGGEGGNGGAGSKGISEWDTGPDGGKGGLGGTGGTGGVPTKGAITIGASVSKIYIYGGNGGKGGSGGRGGDGGISNGNGVLIIDNSRHKGLNGGKGGNGGTGGVSSINLIQNNYKDSFFVFVNADKLKPGAGGNAGAGGAKGYIYNHSWDHGTYYGSAGSPGSSGSKGAY